jgi:hypothetical protein
MKTPHKKARKIIKVSSFFQLYRYHGSNGLAGKAESWLQWPSREGRILASIAKQGRQNSGFNGQAGKAESCLQWPSREGRILSSVAKQGRQNTGFNNRARKAEYWLQ